MKPLAALSIAIALTSAAPEQAPAPPATPKGGPPIDVVLMVDVSGSITQGVFKRDASLITDAAAALASAMAPGDTARVGTFGSEVRLNPEPLRDPEAVHTAARALTAMIGGASPLWDALDVSAVVLSTAGSRRGIIVLTDGRSSANKTSFADALTKLEHARVAVFAIGLESGGAPEPNPTARLSFLADVTGGAYRPAKRKEVEAAVTQAVAGLRAAPSATAR
jgi:Mg-chelatase subunit ChlD